MQRPVTRSRTTAEAPAVLYRRRARHRDTARGQTRRRQLAQAYREAGATHFVHTQDYSSPEQYQELVDIVTSEIQPAVR